MIKQCAVTDIESRSECNPYTKQGFLPLITAPMYSVVNNFNYQVFLDNKIQVCLPRGLNKNRDNFITSYPIFISLSLQDFIEQYVDREDKIKESSTFVHKICIDTAAGHLKKLHEAIRKAKEIHGDNLIIMSGNVASAEAFIELAKTGVDYIRVGIGGGSGCNTTSNIGAGQKNLVKLIKECKQSKPDTYILNKFKNVTTIPFQYNGSNWVISNYYDALNVSKVKIVADGISTYIKQCQDKYGWNDNGYAAINSLLFAGADLVMVGTLFAQCVESAGEKGYKFKHISTNKEIYAIENTDINFQIDEYDKNNLFVKYSGMSTVEMQKKYQPFLQNLNILDGPEPEEDKFTYTVKKEGEPYQNLKPSEGSVKWVPVRWTLDEWLNGSENQDESPYLMGWVNSLKSAMSYTNKRTLEF